MEIKTRMYKNSLYLTLNGELDEHSSIYTRETLDNILVLNSSDFPAIRRAISPSAMECNCFWINLKVKK